MDFVKLDKSYEEAQFQWICENFFATMQNTTLTPFHEIPIFNFAGASWQMSLAKHRSSFLDLYLSLEAGEEQYMIGYNVGIRERNGRILQLDTGRYLFTKDPSNNGVRPSGRIAYLYFKNLKIKKDYLVPFGQLTIVVTLRRDNSHVPKFPKKEQKILIGLNTLSKDFNFLFGNKEGCDTTLYVRGREFKAHRAVLIARSSVFAAMFRHDTLENQTGEISITDSDPKSFEMFLKYLYTGKMDEPSFGSALHLYEMSEKYDIKELKSYCWTLILENFKLDNFSDLVVIADKYGDPKLWLAAQYLFKENAEAIQSTTEWQCLLECNNRLVNQLMTENC